MILSASNSGERLLIVEFHSQVVKYQHFGLVDCQHKTAPLNVVCCNQQILHSMPLNTYWKKYYYYFPDDVIAWELCVRPFISQEELHCSSSAGS